VLGVDPDPARLWPPDARAHAEPVGRKTPSQRAVEEVVEHCRALVDAAAPACVAVKLQLACFEALGEGGRGALDTVAAHARALGLLVIADGKRGDIDVSSRAYASALFDGLHTPFGRLAGLNADLATVNPLMGRDAVEPFVSAARALGAGVLLLVHTSNPGAADFQDLRLEDGQALW
jgi:orotidine-5'-phosphate decarboxylase